MVGGTSAVAPLLVGLIALMNQSLGVPVGYLNPLLYTKVAAISGVFHDITSGNNGTYSCEKGYDLVTGWGSPNESGLINSLAP